MAPRYTVLTARRPKYKNDANFWPIKRDGSSCRANSLRYLVCIVVEET